MTRRNLQHCIQGLDSADGQYVLIHPHVDPVTASWLDAESDAVAAYETWARDRDDESFAVYRAYADQADAAQDALAAARGSLIA
jgi:hypothetical protein